ncbi:MAG: AAA family ATPase [Duodenibacillus sp.]|nr:AAA family ATPase [Duodenibacillus sp.]
MIKIAIYGKGGIGKSTTVSNLSANFSAMGLKVMQVGCDPKADSTLSLMKGRRIPSVLNVLREKGAGRVRLEDIVFEGEGGVLCVEAGGPPPGTGCAGRGIIVAFETLEKLGAFERHRPDVVLYDVLGDVVCGGFAMPIRRGYAEKVFIVTSGEAMAIYAAANIATAVGSFETRGYARLGGFILNRRNVPGEDARVEQLAADFGGAVTARIDRSEWVQRADAEHRVASTLYPESPAAAQYRALARAVLAACRELPGAAGRIIPIAEA